MLVGMFGGYHIRFDHSLLGSEIRCAASMIAFASESEVPLVVHSIYAERRPSALQLLQGPAQLVLLQVPAQVLPWHSARLPVPLRCC